MSAENTKSLYDRAKDALSFSLELGIKSVPNIMVIDENENPFGVGAETLAGFSPCLPQTIFYNKSVITGRRQVPISIEAVTFHELGHYHYFHSAGYEVYSRMSKTDHEIIANDFAGKALMAYAKTSRGKSIDIKSDLQVLGLT